MKRLAAYALFCALLAAPVWAAEIPATSETSNPEMKAIFDADQSDREVRPIDWKVVAPRDERRLARTKELVAQGALHTGEDFGRASLVYQHSDNANDYLMAHLLAMASLGKGNTKAAWLASATLDRYLAKIGQKQVIGTQYFKPKDEWTQEPYDRELVSDALRKVLGVESQAEQEKFLKQLQQEGR